MFHLKAKQLVPGTLFCIAVSSGAIELDRLDARDGPGRRGDLLPDSAGQLP